MNAISWINLMSEAWASWMWYRVIDSSILFLMVSGIWLLIRPKAPPHVGYLLFSIVLVKLIVPWEISIPALLTSHAPHMNIGRSLQALDIDRWTDLKSDGIESNGVAKQIENSGQSTINPNQNHPGIPSPPPSMAAVQPPLPITTKGTVFLLWSGIVCILTGLFIRAEWRTRRRFQQASRIDPANYAIDLTALQKTSRVRHSISWLSSGSIRTPITYGYAHPSIVLPSDMLENFTPHQIRWILLHELAHFRRRDHWVYFIQKILSIGFFFHPAVWCTNGMMNQLREYACDDEALLRSEIDRDVCGEGFLSLIREANRPVAHLTAPLALMNYKTHMRRRMMRILDESRMLSSKMSFGAIFVTLVVSGLMFATVKTAIVENDASKKDPENQVYSRQGFTLRQFPKDYYPDHWLNLISSLPTNDGKYATGIYYKSGDPKSCNLILRNLTTGKDMFLTSEGSTTPSDFSTYERVENSSISPDSGTVAYSWGIKKNPSDFHAELRLVDIDGSNQRTLLTDDNLIASVIRWTNDGKSLFCQLRWSEPLRIEFALVSVKDGSIQVLRTIKEEAAIKDAYVVDRYPEHYTFLSPDEKYLAYTYYPDSKNDAWNSEIAIWSVEEQKEYPFIIHPSMDKLFGWSPDGKWIVFSSNRLSTNDLYYAPFSLERKAINPTIITRGLGQIHPIGITSNGRMYFSDAVNLSDVYTATIQLDAKTIAEDSESISTSIKSPLKESGKWSPDGNLFLIEAFDADYGVDNKKSYWIYSFKEKRSYKIPMTFQLASWSSFESWKWFDNQHIIGAVMIPDDSNPVLYKNNIRTGEATQIAWEEPFGMWGVLTHDLKKYYSTRTNDNIVTLYEYNRETKEERILYKNESDSKAINRHFRFKLSPDEKWLVCTYYEESTNFQSVRLISIENGEDRDLYYEYDNTQSIGNIEWMPDSKSVLCSLNKDKEDNNTLLMLNINDSIPVELGTIPENANFLRVHPSGKKIAYTRSYFESSHWMMENFLPSE